MSEQSQQHRHTRLNRSAGVGGDGVDALAGAEGQVAAVDSAQEPAELVLVAHADRHEVVPAVLPGDAVELVGREGTASERRAEPVATEGLHLQQLGSCG